MDAGYESFKETVRQWSSRGPTYRFVNEGTEYEAIIVVHGNGSQFGGFVTFKDVRFSPVVPDTFGMQYKHVVGDFYTQSGCLKRAEQVYEMLVGIFKSLQVKE